MKRKVVKVEKIYETTNEALERTIQELNVKVAELNNTVAARRQELILISDSIRKLQDERKLLSTHPAVQAVSDLCSGAFTHIVVYNELDIQEIGTATITVQRYRGETKHSSDNGLCKSYDEAREMLKIQMVKELLSPNCYRGERILQKAKYLKIEIPQGVIDDYSKSLKARKQEKIEALRKQIEELEAQA